MTHQETQLMSWRVGVTAFGMLFCQKVRKLLEKQECGLCRVRIHGRGQKAIPPGGAPAPSAATAPASPRWCVL